jgi:hypothetical protein
MAMRETVGSMRAYFVVAGILGALMNVGLIAQGRSNVVALLLGAIGMLSAVAFLYIGARLPALVAAASAIVSRILVITSVYLVLLLLLGLASGSHGVGMVVQSGIGLLIMWYLLRNFRRLAKEAATRSAT